MIKYALRCAETHEFESWFRDSGSFDTLSSGGLVACPRCGSTRVQKAMMAPSVQTSRGKATPHLPSVADEPTVPTAPAALPLLDERTQKLRAMMRELRSQVLEHSKNVGPAFADEARKIHDGVSEEKAIHGVASPDEVRSLIEDGIGVMPLPVFPDEVN